MQRSHHKAQHRHAATYRGFRQVARTGNWYCKNLRGVGPCTVFCSKHDAWSAFLDGEPLDLWLDSAEEAMDAAIATAEDWAGYDAPQPQRPAVPECLQVFGMTPPVDVELLKLRHRQLAMLTHPDKASGNAAEFRRIQTAFEEAMQWL